MPSLEEIRASAELHARQLDAVNWIGVKQLAARWGVSEALVRKIPRAKLAYITLGGTSVRRYHPSDVEAFEDRERQGAA